MRVTAKEYLKKKGLKNPPLDSGISGGGSGERQYASTLMDEWLSINTKSRTHSAESAIRLAEMYQKSREEYKDQHTVPLIEVLEEAKLQIEYLHRKFSKTGSGESVLSRIETALLNAKA